MRILLLLSLSVFLSIGINDTWARPQTHADVRMHEGVPALYINDTLYPPFAYMSYLGEVPYYRSMAESGIHLYCFPAYLGDQGINCESGIGLFREPIWKDYNRFDFSSMQQDLEKIVSVDPQARIIMRIYLDPPKWWVEKNPEDACLMPDGTHFRQCFASEKWKKDTGKALLKCVKWLQNSSYAEHIVGIHVAAGGTEEWYYHLPQRNDRNPILVTAFRSWLKDKYAGQVSELQRAWRDSLVTFETATMVDMNRAPENRWLKPAEARQTFDTYQFHSEVMVDDIIYFCQLVKKATSDRWLTGVFYGYHNNIVDPRMGHCACAKLLECEYVDYMSSPNRYLRVAGEDWPPMVAVQSIMHHGKLWLAENDTRTCLTTLLKDKAPEITPPGQYEAEVWHGPKDMETSVSLMWKNAGRMLAQGYGGWWFDMWGGWYDDPRLLEVIRHTKDFYAKYGSVESKAMGAEVCVVVDEQYCFMDASYGAQIGYMLLNIFALAKTGAPYDHYLRTDLFSLDMEKYKTVWLMGVQELTDREKDLIHSLLEKGVTVMWTGPEGTHLYSENSDIFEKDVLNYSEDQLRSIFEKAGVHIYDHGGDVFYVGRDWLCIHTLQAGEKHIDLPFEARVIDPVNEEILYRSTRTIDFDMEANSTLIFRVEPL